MDAQDRVQGIHVDIGSDESNGTAWAVGPYTVVRVKPTGNDTDDGSSWLSAKRTVQSAIDTASVLGGEVWVAAGTYDGTSVVTPFAHVYGGFAGTETKRQDRQWVYNPTVLDGQNADTVVIGCGGYRCSTIDGFKIQNGSNVYGGGFYSYAGASPFISNNIFTGNTALSGGAIALGVDNTDGGSPVIANNVIVSNEVTYVGSGLYSPSSSPVVVNNTFADNTCTDNYGSIYFGRGSAAMTNNIVAYSSGGIYKESAATVALNNNCLFGNTEYNYGGLSAGATDISVDPKFVSRTPADYHLNSTSPCIDTGSNTAPMLPLLDIDAELRICGAAVDIGADEIWGWINLPTAKMTFDGVTLKLGDAIITAVFDDCFYVETENRECGIRVDLAHTNYTRSTRVNVIGSIMTDDNGERCVEHAIVTPAGTGSVDPLIVANRDLGGSNFLYSSSLGSGQRGVDGGAGLNNIGLLIKTTGLVTAVEDGYFIINDGSPVLGGIRVYCGSLTKPSLGQQVAVTGISIVRKIDDIYTRSVRLRSDNDLQVLRDVVAQ
jgi:hypothetical protein